MSDRKDFIETWLSRPRTWRFWKWDWPYLAISGAGLLAMAVIVVLALHYPEGIPT